MTQINIIVCAKQIPDPEAPLSDVRVDAENMEVIVDAPQVISPFDENALEAARSVKRGPGWKNNRLEPGPESLGYGHAKEPGSRCGQVDTASG